jgi:mono/diheme cytochrome c family protein
MTMKKSIVLIVLTGAGFMLFLSFAKKNEEPVAMPGEVKEMLEASCYGCHTHQGRNQDAKDALNFDEWENYRLTKQIGALDKIAEMVGEEKMPPKKFLEFQPDKNLNKEQREMVVKWANEQAASLMGGEEEE